jgi:hypothetical protein
MLAMLAYMIWPKSHDIEFGSIGERKQERKQNRNVSKTEIYTLKDV